LKKWFLHDLKKVFTRLRKVNLKVNLKKCNLFRKNVNYLGHVVSAGGVTTDPEKIATIKDWVTPGNKKQLQRFLRFSSYYRKFVKGFSQIVRPFFCFD